jgi:hypothetical protein
LCSFFVIVDHFVVYYKAIFFLTEFCVLNSENTLGKVRAAIANKISANKVWNRRKQMRRLLKETDASSLISSPPVQTDASSTISSPPVKMDASSAVSSPPIQKDASSEISSPPIQKDASLVISSPHVQQHMALRELGASQEDEKRDPLHTTASTDL